MYSELNSVADEVKQIEGKVVEISQLVDVFSEKILQQVADKLNTICPLWWVSFDGWVLGFQNYTFRPLQMRM